jgi:hypothetical protein
MFSAVLSEGSLPGRVLFAADAVSLQFLTHNSTVLRLGTLSFRWILKCRRNIRCHNDRIVVLEIRLHSERPMLYRAALHGNWHALSLARRALKGKFPTPTVPLTAELPNRQVFLANPAYIIKIYLSANQLHVSAIYSHHQAEYWT